jgi:hypothetical protein
MSPIPGPPQPLPPPPPPLGPWAWLEADDALRAKVDHFVGLKGYPDRATVLRHAARVYFKLPPTIKG